MSEAYGTDDSSDTQAVDPIITEAKDFLRQVMDAETDMRQEALEDLRFRFGEQWPTEMRAARSIPGQQRPMLTINETDSYCRQVVNQMRQQRPRGKAHPLNSTSDKKIAEIFTGVGRHIEVNSDADNAYDLAAEFQVTMGVGYWRILMDYVDPKSFNQDIYVVQIDNPFSVYFDQFSTKPDGSDAKKCLITDFIPRSEFKKMYPDADSCEWTGVGDGDGEPDWSTQDAVRIAEYYCIKETPMELLALSTGSVVWKDEIAPAELAQLEKMGVTVVNRRMSSKNQVMWYKLTGHDVLETRDVPGRYIPVIPCYGMNIIIDGKKKRFGMVRFARDPQMMVNYWKTSLTETLAMTPKAKWLMAEGQDEGHEAEFAQANNSPLPTLRYKPTDVEGNPAPPPQRLQPESVPAGLVESIGMASQDLQRVLGMFDPAQIRQDATKSGTAVQAEAGQAEMGNYHFYDNQCRSIKHEWRIFFDYMPVAYDTQRVLRVIGADGSANLVTVNEKKMVDGVQVVLNNIKDAEVGVEVEVGPGYNTKRQEAADVMMNLLRTPLGEEIGKVGADLIVRTIDGGPIVSELADRLAAANPLSQIDQQSDVPPQAQMQIKALQQQLQQMTQHLQAMQSELKNKGQIEGMKQAAATHRTEITAHQKMLSDKLWAAEEAAQVKSVERTKLHDTATRALTAQNVEEIRGLVQLMLKHLDTAALGDVEKSEDSQLEQAV